MSVVIRLPAQVSSIVWDELSVLEMARQLPMGNSEYSSCVPLVACALLLWLVSCFNISLGVFSLVSF